jgi:hypothetical protein
MTASEETSGISVLPVHLICAGQAAARCEMSDHEWGQLLAQGACPAARFLSRDGVALWNQDELDDWCAAGQPRRWGWAKTGPNLEGGDRSPYADGWARNRGDKFALLAHYASRKPQQFAQYDGFTNCGTTRHDDVQGDQDGHAVMLGLKWELMVGAPVRVLIPASTRKEDAVALLKKVADWIERDGVYRQEKANAEERVACGDGGDIPF